MRQTILSPPPSFAISIAPPQEAIWELGSPVGRLLLFAATHPNAANQTFEILTKWRSRLTENER